MILTSQQIKDRIVAHDSFWIGTERERNDVLTISRAFGLRYTTRKAVGGGFYAFPVPKIKHQQQRN